MPNFLIAVAIVVGGLWLIRKFAKTPSHAVPNLMKRMGGMAIIAVSVLVALRGNINTALPLFAFGLAMIGIASPFAQNFNWGGKKTADQKSRVQTSMLVMELDHDSGQMDGDILVGPTKGRRISSLSDTELKTLHTACKSVPDQSRLLLEAWLDRQRSTWRTDWQEFGSAPATSGGTMSRDEAFAVLGLAKSASADDIKSAHRRLMKELHPDKGGSDYLAAKINQAKDILLG